jgi:sulfate transport system ATP-binding protein
MSVEVRDVSKRFGMFEALRRVSLEIETGELVALLGPSGSGKTTLLRIISGLEAADDGAIFLHGEDATHRDVRDRQVGFVFQHYALFRHLNVFDNIAFGLEVRPRGERLSKAAIRSRVHELLELVQLEQLARRFPAQLSGGQRQRVALARALAIEPRVLLLDEPFGALDSQVRQELRRWLRQLHDDLKITGLLVTHDQEEALEVADRVAILNAGRIEQVGTPAEVYDEPASPFVFNFLGNVNQFHGLVDAGRLRFGAFDLEATSDAGASGSAVVGYVRPHDLQVARERQATPSLEAVVQHVRPAGPVVRLELRRADTGDPLEAALTRESYRSLGLTAGERVYVEARNLRIFPQQRIEQAADSAIPPEAHAIA